MIADSSIFVFLGPTMPAAHAARILDANYLPPVAMGDVVRALSYQPKAIAIIDGVFETTPSVWHKEILFALSQGVQVLGSSSMGALRAAELHDFGMIGIGRIFEAYRDGTVDADDEVAVAHAGGRDGYRAMSDALVNIREGLRQAVEMGALSSGAAARLVAGQQRQFYPYRSWNALLASGTTADVSVEEMAALSAAVPEVPDLKREDAIELLAYMRDSFRDGVPAHVATFDFEPTYYWNGLVALEGVAGMGSGNEWVSNSALGRHLRLTRQRRPELVERALLSFLLFHEARRCGVAVPLPAGISPPTDAGYARWQMADVRTCADAVDGLKAELIAALDHRIDFFIAAELARRGELDPVLEEVGAKLRVLRDHGSGPRLSDLGIDLQVLSDWYEERFGNLAVSGDVHAGDLGFPTWEDFIAEVILDYVVAHQPAGGASADGHD